MKKKKIQNVLLILVGLVVLALSGNFLAIFQQTDKTITQFHISQSDINYVGNCHNGLARDSLGCSDGEILSTGAQQPSTINPLENSVVSSSVSINTGKGIYQFNSEKTGQGTSFGLVGNSGNPNLRYCYQRIAVLKDGILIDTFKSWGDDTDPDGSKDFFKSHTYFISPIEIKMEDLNFGQSHARFSGNCPIFVNSYKLILDNNNFDISLSTPQQTTPGGNTTIDMIIKNNLDREFLADVNTIFSLNTLFGEAIYNKSSSAILIPGDNLFQYDISLGENNEFNVEVEVDLKSSGNAYTGLNFGAGTINDLGRCIGTTGSGSCDNWQRRTKSGASPRIQSIDKIPIGRIISGQFTISVIEPEVLTSPEGTATIPGQTQIIITAPELPPSATNVTILPPSTPSTSILSNINIEIILMIMAVLLILVFIILKFRRK